MKDLLLYLAHERPGSVGSLEATLAASRDAGARFASTFDRAVAGGFDAARVAFAFGAAYEAALVRLQPQLEPGKVRVLCVTEEGGGHPRAIRARLERRGEGWSLDGEKRWATLGPHADELLVVAATGIAGNKSLLRLARVPRLREGVTVHAMPPTPFAPELPHARVSFEAVSVTDAELFEGDAYQRFIKPFRTIEDVHVLAAVAGHVAGLARSRAWPRDSFEDALALIGALRSIAPLDPLAPETHVALGGAIRLTRALFARVASCWNASCAQEEEGARERWARDQPLLDVAAGPRAKRLENAWAALLA